MRPLWACQSGSTVVAVAIALPVLSFVAVGAFDFWNTAADRSLMQNVADASALAGAAQLAIDTSSATASRAQSYATSQLKGLIGDWSTLRQRGDLFDLGVIAELEGFAANGRGAFVEKVVGLFCDNAPDCIARLEAATNSGCAEDAAKASHALKSMSYTIGAKAVAAAAEELEIRSRGGVMPDAPATAQLTALLTATVTSLRT